MNIKKWVPQQFTVQSPLPPCVDVMDVENNKSKVSEKKDLNKIVWFPYVELTYNQTRLLPYFQCDKLK